MTSPAVIDAFGSQSGQLTVGGVPVERLAERMGATPFLPTTVGC